MDLKFSHSMRQMFLVCPRKVYFTYCAGIQRKDRFSEALIIGRTFHNCLELIRNKKEFGETMEGVLDLLKKSKDPVLNSIKIEAYILGYFKIYDDMKRNVKTEVPVSWENNVGIIDCLVEDGEGEWVMVEDKTTSLFDPNIEYFLNMNDQIATYTYLAEKNGYKIKAILYRELQKSTHKLNKGETLEDFKKRMYGCYVDTNERYRQFVVNPSSFNLERHEFLIAQTNYDIAEFVEESIENVFDFIPKNVTACLGKYGACDFLEICAKAPVTLCDIYEPNEKDPYDGNAFRTEHEILGLSEIDETMLIGLEVEEKSLTSDYYTTPKYLARFIECFDVPKTIENVEKIIYLFFKMNDYERIKFITQRGKHND
jgi:CRISPR/Cas system-associated exonuclease Cas4 (RecB family)